MIRFALIVASTLGFVLTAALGNFMAPLLQELERFRPQEQQEPQTPVQSRVPALGGLCLMVSTLAAVGVGWTAACIAQPTLLGSESQLMTRLLIALFGAQAFGAIGLADDAARLRSRAQLGLRRLPRLALEAAAAAAVLVLLAVNGCLPTGLQLPGAGYVELGGAAPVLWGLVLVALAECARTADGADGTVCGTAFAAMLGLMMLETRLGWFPLAVLPAALAGALLAFLLWNFPPAKLRPPVSGRGAGLRAAVHRVCRVEHPAGSALLGRGRHGAFADPVLPHHRAAAVPGGSAAPLAGSPGRGPGHGILLAVCARRMRPGACPGLCALRAQGRILDKKGRKRADGNHPQKKKRTGLGVPAGPGAVVAAAD